MNPPSIIVLAGVALLGRNVDALTCYSCGVIFTSSTYGESALCQGFNETTPTMECTNSTYCLSKYAHIDEPIWFDGQEYHNFWAHSCAQHLFEGDILGNDIDFCQNKGNGCFKQDDYDYEYDEDTHYSATDISYCCCDSDLCNTNSDNNPDPTTTNSNNETTTNSNSNETTTNSNSNETTTTNSNSNETTTTNSNSNETTTNSPDNGADFIQCSVLAVSAVLMAILV